MDMQVVENRSAIIWNGTLGNMLEAIVTDKQYEERATLVGTAPERQGIHGMSDEQLMSQVGTGNSQALEQLYDRHVRGCFGLAMKIVRDPAVAEEVVQDVFMKLWSNPDRFSPDRGKFSGWLLTLVHNRSVDKLRRAKSGANNNIVPLYTDTPGTQVADMLPDDAPSPHDYAWSNEKGRMVRDALTFLTEAQRQTISLAYFDGLTQKEIAEKLNEPLGTIKTRTRSALQHLRRTMGQQNMRGELL